MTLSTLALSQRDEHDISCLREVVFTKRRRSDLDSGYPLLFQQENRWSHDPHSISENYRRIVIALHSRQWCKSLSIPPSRTNHFVSTTETQRPDLPPWYDCRGTGAWKSRMGSHGCRYTDAVPPVKDDLDGSVNPNGRNCGWCVLYLAEAGMRNGERIADVKLDRLGVCKWGMMDVDIWSAWECLWPAIISS